MGSTDWINLAVDRDTYRAFVNTVMNRRVYKMLVIFLLAEELLAFLGLFSMQSVLELSLPGAELSPSHSSSLSHA